MSNLKFGLETIRAVARSAPEKAGVYKMKDINDRIIYVGKAKHLPKRIVSYASHFEDLSNRLKQMISQINTIELDTTVSEREALLLESNLIKKHQPKYNIMLKDGKSFPYIMLNTSHKFPSTSKYRGARTAGREYFGPFASVGNVLHTIDTISKQFMVRTCSDHEFARRQTPCLQYQIKRCTAPCVGLVSEDSYHEQIKEMLAFMRGQGSNIQDILYEKMLSSSNAQSYEQAAMYRDRLNAIRDVQAVQNINIDDTGDIDFIAVVEEEGVFACSVCFFRGGSNYGTSTYFPVHTEKSTMTEVVTAFIEQFYIDNEPGTRILINMETKITENDIHILQSYLYNLHEKKITISVPKYGQKKLIMDEIVSKTLYKTNETLNNKISNGKLMGEIDTIFNFPTEKIARIEVFDNSHIQGTHAVGALISVTEGGFEKSRYRCYNIPKEIVNGGDDYAMLRYSLLKRYRPLAESSSDDLVRPDIVIVDGGKGHFFAAVEIFKELGLKIPIICMAKGEERNKGKEEYFIETDYFKRGPSDIFSFIDFFPSKNMVAFRFKDLSKLAHFLQRIRDEAHRYAIMSHRKKRENRFSVSVIDEIPNVGKKTKQMLLTHFASVENLRSARVEEIASVPGIGKKMAQIIYYFMQNQI